MRHKWKIIKEEGKYKAYRIRLTLPPEWSFQDWYNEDYILLEICQTEQQAINRIEKDRENFSVVVKEWPSQ